jgi:Ca2+-binding RTX toxin-like protein
MTTLHYTSGGSAAAVAAAGFNLVDVQTVEQLNALPEGTMGLIWLDEGSGVTASFLAKVTPFIGNPKLFGFFLVDEPDPTGKWNKQATPASLMAESDWIHANLPGAKTFITMMDMGSSKNPNFMNTYTPANTHIDYFGLDPYPVRSDQTTVDYNMIDRTVAAALAAGIPLSQIVPVFQAFGGGTYRNDTGGQYVVPTAAQMQIMFDHWQALVPNPAFDYAYAWGSQQGDTALESALALQQVFLTHNLGGDLTIYGNSNANLLNGGAGNDTIAGFGGDDTLMGNGGNDTINAGDGNDFVYGGVGDDFVIGGMGNDRIDTGAGVDTIDYSAAGSALFIDLRAATQSATGGFGIDVITTVENVLGGAFADTLIGDAGVNGLYGGAGADSLVTMEGNDFAYGGAGNDYISGRDGHDWLYGDDGNDVIDGGLGFDTLRGNAGDDFIIGGANDDTIYGGDGAGNAGDVGDQWLGGDGGNDVIYGNLGTDRLSGGDGNDVLVGGEGYDYLTGEAGADTFVYNAPSDGSVSEMIGDWQGGIDKLQIDASAFGGGLAAGALAANRLVLGAVANQAFGQFLYNAANGVLSWDADGTGSGAAVAITELFTSAFALPPATLAVTDFDIVV